LVPYKFTPIIIIPSKNNNKNIFLHILINLKNITASNPIFSINDSSDDDITGLTHENNPLPSISGSRFLEEEFEKY
jgi:hypothetical protein